MQKQILNKIFLMAALFLTLPFFANADWQSSLKGAFPTAKVVESFDELQDWSVNGQVYSGGGCAGCISNKNLPKKNDGSDSIWGSWNNKGLSFEYTPESGSFAIGDVIVGSTSGATSTIKQIWNVDGKSYIQLTSNGGTLPSPNFSAGERITSGSKTGTNLKWPLFIADHGLDANGTPNSWKGSGKSLVINLGNNSASTSSTNPPMEGLGAQRMATYFGDGVSGKSGYKKAYMFFMMKISPDFFKRCESPFTGCPAGGYAFADTVKTFDLDSGFTGVNVWGTAADRTEIDTNSATYFVLPEYGVNFSVFNIAGGGLSNANSLYFNEFTQKAVITQGSLYGYTYDLRGRPMRSGTSTDINAFTGLNNSQWFGVELAYDIGTPDTYDSTVDLWIYDKNGTERGHYAVTGDNHLVHFDHYYNKFVFGGNRLTAAAGTVDGLDARFWVDDLVINDSRIGPAYFSLLNSTADTTAPAAPTGLNVQ
jgi:hypothetical protein